jgi:uncharacterized protein YerC
MTQAQKNAQANFKKAIAYRKKSGCTLKEAFAHVKKTTIKGLDGVVKKGNKTTVLYSKNVAVKKATQKKKVVKPTKKQTPKIKVVKQQTLFGIKKYTVTLSTNDDDIVYAYANTLTEANKLYMLAQKVKVKDMLRSGYDFVLINIYDNLNDKVVKEKSISNKNI